MFNPTMNLKKLNAFIAECKEASFDKEDYILQKAFDHVSWRIKKEAGKVVQNPHWITFAKLIGIGGRVNAALLLVPEGHRSSVGDVIAGGALARVMPVNGTLSYDGAGYVGEGATWSIAICIAALQAHVYLYECVLLNRHQETPHHVSA